MIQLRHPTRGLLAGLALVTLGACASSPDTAAPTTSDDKGEIVTGSNIPRRQGNTGTNRVTTLNPVDATPAGPAPAR
jgi:hypothetical protein